MCNDISVCMNEIMSLPIFSGFSKDQVCELLAGSHIKTHYHGDVLFRVGESADFFGYVLSGTYKISHCSDQGEEMILYFGSRGEGLAIMAVMDKSTRYPFDARSMGTSRFLLIPRANFMKNWICNPTLALRFQTEIQTRLFRSYDEKRISATSLAQRVANLLIYLAEHKSSSESDVIDIPLTRREIASYVGSSVESVIRKMSLWTQKGWLTTNDSHIQILNRRALQSIARGHIEPDQIAAGREPQVASGAHLPESSLLTELWQKSV